jgi:predicted transcriptional regulator
VEDMMKHEFEKLVGMTIDPACYERIEFVYTNSEQFSNTNGKQEIADFYKKHDMNGIEKLYKELVEEETRTEEFKQFVSDLATFADGYVEEIKQHLVEIAMDTFKNKTIVNLLHEYAIRKAKEQKNLADDFRSALQYPDLNISFSNNCLTNAGHYKTVIAGLLVDEWWHKQNKGN